MRRVCDFAYPLQIVMEFCSAGSIADLTDACELELTEDQIAAIMKQCLAGLKYLHGAKKIHRHAADILTICAVSRTVDSLLLAAHFQLDVACQLRLFVEFDCRDIKAANILLSEGGVCKLADFGVRYALRCSVSSKG